MGNKRPGKRKVAWNDFKPGNQDWRKRPAERRKGEPPPPVTGRVFGYGRASKAWQETTMAVQEKQCVGYFEWKLQPLGYTWGGWYADVATSGAKKFRERQAGAALDAVMQHGDHVIISKQDRGFRGIVDTYETVELWKKRGIKIHFLDIGLDTDTLVGEVMMGLFAVMAHAERRRRSERLKESAAERKLQGKMNGGVCPLGFTKSVTRRPGKVQGKVQYDRVLVPHLAEQKLMRRIYLLRRNGETLRAVQGKLRRSGLTTRKGGRTWDYMTILLYDRKYKELLEQGKVAPQAMPEDGVLPAESHAPCDDSDSPAETTASIPFTATPPPPSATT